MRRLIDSLTKLPGVGTKTAARLAYHIVDMSAEDVAGLADAIRNIKTATRTCAICFTTIDSEREICEICESPHRDGRTICVVKDSKDLDAIERAGSYSGKYHVTGGLISPMAGITQENIRLSELIDRVRENDIAEVIVAFEPSVEGNITATYIARSLRPLNVKTTKIAQGMAVGADFAGTDQATISKAIENRVPI